MTFAPAVKFLSVSKGEVQRWGRSLCAIEMVTDLCFYAFSKECCDGNFSGKGCVLSPSGDTRGCEIQDENSNPTGGGGGGTGEEGRQLLCMICINHPIYPLGTIFQSAFRMEWFITTLACGPDMPISTKNSSVSE